MPHTEEVASGSGFPARYPSTSFTSPESKIYSEYSAKSGSGLAVHSAVKTPPPSSSLSSRLIISTGDWILSQS